MKYGLSDRYASNWTNKNNERERWRKKMERMKGKKNDAPPAHNTIGIHRWAWKVSRTTPPTTITTESRIIYTRVSTIAFFHLWHFYFKARKAKLKFVHRSVHIFHVKLKINMHDVHHCQYFFSARNYKKVSIDEHAILPDSANRLSIQFESSLRFTASHHCFLGAREDLIRTNLGTTIKSHK